MAPALWHIDTWIFDLDNTLYPPECALFDLIDEKMRAYIAALLDIPELEAHLIQKTFFRDHGTTLAGLIAHHGVDPHHFLDFVHDIDLTRLAMAPRLRGAISALPGRKIIFTNADADYATRVLAALEMEDLFSDIVDIHHMGYTPKPQAPAYATLMERTAIDPARSLFVEDMARNLAPAKALGMTTVWVNNGSEYGCAGADHLFIDLEIPHLAGWLSAPYLIERAT
ncbi:MAG: pyrimidine 5'-nucleotidase [Sphingorhabdus sp.]